MEWRISMPRIVMSLAIARMKAAKAITILVIALILASQAFFLSEARHLATRKHQPKAFKQCEPQSDKRVIGRETMKVYKGKVVHRREIISTIEDVRPATPGHSPGVGHKTYKLDD